MIQLLFLLMSVGMVVLGALGLIGALGIPGRIRSFLACLAACVPITLDLCLFFSSNLHRTNFQALVQTTTHEFKELVQGLKETQDFKEELQEVFPTDWHTPRR